MGSEEPECSWNGSVMEQTKLGTEKIKKLEREREIGRATFYVKSNCAHVYMCMHVLVQIYRYNLLHPPQLPHFYPLPEKAICLQTF